MGGPRADPAALVAAFAGALAPPVAVIGALSGHDAARVRASTEESWFFGTDALAHAEMTAAGIPSELGTWPSRRSRSAIVFMPKGKDRARMALAMAASCVGAGGAVWLVGEKRGGIDAAKALDAGWWSPADVESGRHSRLVRGTARSPDGVVPTLDMFWTTWTVDLGRPLRIASLPGVFSDGRLDDGTRLLLEADDAGHDRIVDVGCGAGIIGAWHAVRSGSSVSLIDSDMLACAAATRTLALNEVKGDVHCGDGLAPVSGRIDADILSNPPFHRGVATEYSFTPRLIAEASARRAAGRTVTLVVNRFLDALAPMRAAFGVVDVLADDGRYRVIRGR